MTYIAETERKFTPIIPQGCSKPYWICDKPCSKKDVGTIAFVGERPFDEIGLVVTCTDPKKPQQRTLCARMTTWISEDLGLS